MTPYKGDVHVTGVEGHVRFRGGMNFNSFSSGPLVAVSQKNIESVKK